MVEETSIRYRSGPGGVEGVNGKRGCVDTDLRAEDLMLIWCPAVHLMEGSGESCVGDGNIFLSIWCEGERDLSWRI